MNHTVLKELWGKIFIIYTEEIKDQVDMINDHIMDLGCEIFNIYSALKDQDQVEIMYAPY